MRKRHLTEDEIIDLLENRTPAVVTRKRAAQIAHFDTCDHCAAQFNDLARFVGALGQPTVWDKRPAPAESRGEWLRRVLALLQQLRAEHRELDTILEETLAGEPAGWKGRLAGFENLHTYTMVEALIEKCEATFAGNPEGALTAASLAVEIADGLRIDAYAFDFVISVRARAYLEYAFMLYYRGHMIDALRALDRSEQLFSQSTNAHFQLARVSLVRAIIYRSLDRTPEAIVLADGAAATFAFYGDEARRIKARMTQAAMLIHQKRAADALPICTSLEHAPFLTDTPDYAIVLQNIGICYRDLQQFDQADQYFARAIDEHEKHHATAEKTRTQWSRAANLAASGRIAEALPLYRETSAAFENMGLDTDAALTTLEVVEVLLATGQPAEVPVICRKLLDHFTRNGMTSRAVTALSFLREAVAMGKASPALVRHIADFIRELPKHPAVAFVPPPL